MWELLRLTKCLCESENSCRTVRTRIDDAVLHFQGLPNNIDAAVTWTDTKMTYFFKGNNYWKFDNQEPATGERNRYIVLITEEAELS